MFHYTDPDPGHIVSVITNLHAGESVVYHTGLSGWIDQAKRRHEIRQFFNEAHKSGRWDFTQRKAGSVHDGSSVSVYDYIATRRRVPAPLSLAEMDA